jgi:hypothetical protein
LLRCLSFAGGIGHLRCPWWFPPSSRGRALLVLNSKLHSSDAGCRGGVRDGGGRASHEEDEERAAAARKKKRGLQPRGRRGEDRSYREEEEGAPAARRKRRGVGRLGACHDQRWVNRSPTTRVYPSPIPKLYKVREVFSKPSSNVWDSCKT